MENETPRAARRHAIAKLLGAEIAKLMDHHGINQVELGSLVGVHSTIINKFVNGNSLPIRDTLAKIASVFSLDVGAWVAKAEATVDLSKAHEGVQPIGKVLDATATPDGGLEVRVALSREAGEVLATDPDCPDCRVTMKPNGSLPALGALWRCPPCGGNWSATGLRNLRDHEAASKPATVSLPAAPYPPAWPWCPECGKADRVRVAIPTPAGDTHKCGRCGVFFGRPDGTWITEVDLAKTNPEWARKSSPDRDREVAVLTPDAAPKQPRLPGLDEPDPKAGAEVVWPHVVRYLTDAGLAALVPVLEPQYKKGLAKYGRPLETWNGRRSLVDALQDATDAVLYVQQATLEVADVLAVLREPDMAPTVKVIKARDMLAKLVEG